MSNLIFNNVTFSYDTGHTPIMKDVTLTIDPGWTGVVGINGIGKSTFLKLATGLLHPLHGSITCPGTGLYCEQRTDSPPDNFESFLCSYKRNAPVVRDILGIESDWPERWDCLSEGERKKAWIAVSLWLDPGLLAVDEPTNHLDIQSRKYVARALSFYRGIGLIVSHDRYILDLLCRQCVFMSDTGLVVRPGGITDGKREEKRENETRTKQYRVLKKEKAKIEKEIVRIRESSRSKLKKLSKKGLAGKDHDGRFKRNIARLTGKDGTGGKLTRKMDSRSRHIGKKLENLKPLHQRKMGKRLEGVYSKKKTLLFLQSREIVLYRDRSLVIPDLIIGHKDRISLTGVNGTGKTTLVKQIVCELREFNEKILYLKQEITPADAGTIMKEFHAMSKQERGTVLSYFSRLGSEPENLLGTEEPSPGEIRKLFFAMEMQFSPVLVILDEPTNHLDMASIECMEQALMDCNSALLLVSHDEYFLENLTDIRWNITGGKKTHQRFILTVK
ncbi:MAG: ABC-F family ATP-binding cassette domain-containing protein [Spirochaetales bacterium]|nr:ABC-F family ATP-binding cassette domain-containing protein [Spirochaetales bacterium]